MGHHFVGYQISWGFLMGEIQLPTHLRLEFRNAKSKPWGPFHRYIVAAVGFCSPFQVKPFWVGDAIQSARLGCSRKPIKHVDIVEDLMPKMGENVGNWQGFKGHFIEI